MSVLDILTWPDPRLSQVCAPVADPAEVEDLVGDLFETMYTAPGRGIAAPQVGVMLRVFVMDAGWKDGDMRPVVCINPEILEVSEGTLTYGEGCLSIPGVVADVVRPEAVLLRYTDLGGTRQEAWLSDFDARCAQHELDHLDGKVHLDRLTETDKMALEAAYFANRDQT